MPRILLMRFSSLGDVILLSSLVESLARRDPKPEIWLVTKQAFAQLYENDPRIHRVISLSTGRGAFEQLVQTLETEVFDEILDAHASLRSRALTWRLPPTKTTRIKKDALARIAWTRFRLASRALEFHAVDRYQRMVDGSSAPPRPRIVVSPSHLKNARAELGHKGPWLAIAPGARHATKRWPVESFAQLAQRFQRETNGHVLLVGGPGEDDLVAAVRAACDTPPHERSGRQDLSELAAVLAQCLLFVGNDSGLMHLAEAVDTPTLAVFGPTSRELGFFPRDPRSHVIEHALDCRPCSRTGARPCRMPEQWCMTRSSPQLVFSQLEVLWKTLSNASLPTSS